MNQDFAMIKVSKIRDGDNQPTCNWWDSKCPFYQSRHFGTAEHCFWEHSSMPLERRDYGNGTTMPHDKCPIWSEQS